LNSEVRVVASLSLLYMVRMLGLFMVLPVLFLYGEDYGSASPATLGLALGIYGLTQAIFQVPMGMLSDFIGRKQVIVIGLLVFAAGSAIAALTDSVYGLILGRALQGSGAIAATVMALVADLTSNENRSKAMAAIGASIGLSFTLSLILGPFLAGQWGLSGIFWVSLLLTTLGLIVLLFGVPSTQNLHKKLADEALPRRVSSARQTILQSISDMNLMRLNLGIFVLHATLTAVFIVVPNTLLDAGLEKASHGKLYLPVLLASFMIAVPLMMRMEKRGKGKEVFCGAILLIAGASALLNLVNSVYELALILFLFFVAFNLLEAMLPSQVSKFAPASSRGTAMGVYSTSQFMGAFVGGSVGGLWTMHVGAVPLLVLCACLCALWFLAALGMPREQKIQSLSYSVKSEIVELDLLAQTGVKEATYIAEEGLVYIKVDTSCIDLSALNKLIDPYRLADSGLT